MNALERLKDLIRRLRKEGIEIRYLDQAGTLQFAPPSGIVSTFAGVIRNSVATLALTKIGSGNLALSFSPAGSR